jgi:sulfur relay (sulfurtransferase) complex TusBCD TusD component (DsrE family)
MPTLAIVLSTPPDSGDLDRVERLAQAARAAGHEVSIFLMTDAAPLGASPRAASLVEAGCDVFVCATNFGDGIPAPGVVVGSQDDHAAMVHKADRVVSLT